MKSFQFIWQCIDWFFEISVLLDRDVQYFQVASDSLKNADVGLNYKHCHSL